MKSEFLSNRELRIFKHQIDLPSFGIQGQEKIKNSKILVVGAGGKGSFALQNLAVAGIGSIGICDNHIVEETTLPRQTLYGNGDLGKQKAIIAKEKLIENNPLTNVTIHNIYLSEINSIAIISNYDIIVDATDNFTSHQTIDKAAQQLKKPVVFGAVNNAMIIVSVFNYLEGHSLHQLFPSDPQYQANTILRDWLPGEVILYNLAGSLLANEVLKIVLGVTGILDGKVLKFDVTTYQLSIDVL